MLLSPFSSNKYISLETLMRLTFRNEDCDKSDSQIHPVWPEILQGQGELFFECTLFLYSVLALFLQYLNLYKTMWWLPKSYWHYSLVIFPTNIPLFIWLILNNRLIHS